MADANETKVVGAVQMAPVFLDREATLAKVRGTSTKPEQTGANS